MPNNTNILKTQTMKQMLAENIYLLMKSDEQIGKHCLLFGGDSGCTSVHSFIEWNEKRGREYWNAKLEGDCTEYPFGLPLPTNIHLCFKYKNNFKYKYPDVRQIQKDISNTNTNIHLCHK